MVDEGSDGGGASAGLPGPGEADMLAFHRKLTAVCADPLIARDPECTALIARMTRGPDPAHFADLMRRLAERGLELAYAAHGTASRGIARHGPEQRRAEADDDAGPPPRLMLRL